MLISYVVTILMIVLLESMLSIDNAAVLASIANTKCKERAKDIVRFGIIGAFIFRGLSLFCVSWLMTNEVVGGIGKLLGALYLLRLGYTGLTPQPDSLEEGEVGWIEKIFNKIGISGFWLIVLEVEIIDLVFSIDNLFACVAFTENIKGDFIWFGFTLHKAITLTIIGVILGIITMRYITQYFIKIMEKFPTLEKSAFIVIILLGAKLLLSSLLTFGWFPQIKEIMESHTTDFIFSGIMMLIFFFPIIKWNKILKSR